MIWGMPAEAVILFGGMGSILTMQVGFIIRDKFFPVKQAYCQGCDLVQPAPSMKFTAIGLYRCSECRREPKLLDQAKNLHTTNWAASLDRWGSFTCQCPTCKPPIMFSSDPNNFEHAAACRCHQCDHMTDRERMQKLAQQYPKRFAPPKEGGQFTPITHSSIDWQCNYTYEQRRCADLATYYEWDTGLRYCNPHMMMQPAIEKVP